MAIVKMKYIFLPFKWIILALGTIIGLALLLLLDFISDK